MSMTLLESRQGEASTDPGDGKPCALCGKDIYPDDEPAFTDHNGDSYHVDCHDEYEKEAECLEVVQLAVSGLLAALIAYEGGNYRYHRVLATKARPNDLGRRIRNMIAAACG